MLFTTMRSTFTGYAATLFFNWLGQGVGAHCHAWFLSLRNSTHRTAIPPARRRHSRTFWKIQRGSNCFRNAGGTPLAAASSCVADFFRDALVERKTLAMRCVALMVTRRYDVENSFFRSRAYNNRPEGWPGWVGLSGCFHSDLARRFNHTKTVGHPSCY